MTWGSGNGKAAAAAAVAAKPAVMVASVWRIRELRRRKARDHDKEMLRRQSGVMWQQSRYILWREKELEDWKRWVWYVSVR